MSQALAFNNRSFQPWEVTSGYDLQNKSIECRDLALWRLSCD